MVYAEVERVEEEGGYKVYGKEGLLLRCRRLVHSVGFSPDPLILPNLRRIEQMARGGQHVLVVGFSDTTNMYISRRGRAEQVV